MINAVHLSAIRSNTTRDKQRGFITEVLDIGKGKFPPHIPQGGNQPLEAYGIETLYCRTRSSRRSLASHSSVPHLSASMSPGLRGG